MKNVKEWTPDWSTHRLVVGTIFSSLVKDLTSSRGYGQTGPFAKAAGYDVIIEAEAGLMHMCVIKGLFLRLVLYLHIELGNPTDPPVKLELLWLISQLVRSHSNWSARNWRCLGLYTHGAILAALISREKTGHGVWIDCNLLESQVSRTTPRRVLLYNFMALRYHV